MIFGVAGNLLLQRLLAGVYAIEKAGQKEQNTIFRAEKRKNSICCYSIGIQQDTTSLNIVQAQLFVTFFSLMKRK